MLQYVVNNVTVKSQDVESWREIRIMKLIKSHNFIKLL